MENSEKMYRYIIALQGEEVDEISELMNDGTDGDAIAYMKQWDYGEESEPRVNREGMRRSCGCGTFYDGEHGYIMFRQRGGSLYALYCEVSE